MLSAARHGENRDLKRGDCDRESFRVDERSDGRLASERNSAQRERIEGENRSLKRGRDVGEGLPLSDEPARSQLTGNPPRKNACKKVQREKLSANQRNAKGA